MAPIFLDYAATTPCDPAVIEAMRPFWFEQFGNASSPHQFGRRARKAIEDAREHIAAILKIKPEEIVFTSGASEANNHAIFGCARALAHKGRHLVISAIEHHSILEPVKRLADDGFEVSWVMPDSDGIVHPDAVAAAMRTDTILVAVGHANNEIGTLQPVAQIGQLVRDRQIAFLVDAVQTVGHCPVDFSQIPSDLCSMSAHKFYGPQGVGALWIRKGTACAPFILGGDQERGRRASTQNVAGIVGMARALALCHQHMETEAKTQAGLRDTIIEQVLKQIPGALLNGHRHKRLPNNAHFSCPSQDGEELVAALDLAGVACSVGSACTSGQLQPSHVLKAIGRSDRLALGSLRVTVGRWTTPQDIMTFLDVLVRGTLRS